MEDSINSETDEIIAVHEVDRLDTLRQLRPGANRLVRKTAGGAAAIAIALVGCASTVNAQVLSERGFLEGRGIFFPQTATNDTTRAVGDMLLREEVFVKPERWIQFAGGVDVRANSHSQVEAWDTGWDRPSDFVDVADRGVLRPRISLRRLSATITAGAFTLEMGKQFIRWARADILNPTDRFAPRDFLNVVDTEFLPVTAVRPTLRLGSETFEAVWEPRLTPSRMPLLNQRWTVLPPGAELIAIRDNGSIFPDRAQYGVRWSHTESRIETALSYFDGMNHLPTIDVRPSATDAAINLTRRFPRLRTYGADVAIPTKWITLKSEAAYFAAPDDSFEAYALYVIEVERQTGEWVLTGGYAGEALSHPDPVLSFDPERGLARSIIGRASYTVDPRRTVAIEAAVRQTGDGQYVKGDYSQAIGNHFRITLTGVGMAGDDNDFLGRLKRNSHVSTALRFSF